MSFFSWIYQVKIILANVGFKISNLLLRRSSGPVENSFNLIDGWSSWEHWFTPHHFSNQTTKRPDINLFWVILASEQKLRSSIPSCGYVICHDNSFVVLSLFEGSDQTKIAKFGFAVFVYKHVWRLQIPVNDIRIVKVQNGFGQLVDDVLLVPLLQMLIVSILSD